MIYKIGAKRLEQGKISGITEKYRYLLPIISLRVVRGIKWDELKYGYLEGFPLLTSATIAE